MIALVADAGKCELAAFYLSAGFSGGIEAQLRGDLQVVKIAHAAAACTDEVDMGLGVRVETLHAVYMTKALDQALLLKLGQVSVHGTETQIRVAFLKLQVDPLRAGMGFGTSQGCDDRLPLF